MDINTYLKPEIIDILQTGWYFLMLGLMIIEWPLVTFAAAFLASFGVFNIYIVFILWWFGDILWGFMFYTIGRYGLPIFTKKTLIDTPWEKKLITQLDRLIHKNLILALLIIKFTPYLPPIGLTYIGKIGVDMKKYFFASSCCALLGPSIATITGYHTWYLTNILQKYSGNDLYILMVWIILLFLMIFSFFLFLRKKTKKILEDSEDYGCWR